MSEIKTIRLASAAKELNVGISNIVDHLHAKGFKDVASSPNTKLTEEQYDVLLRDFRSDIVTKEKAEQINIGKRKEEELSIKEFIKKEEELHSVKREEVVSPKIVGKIDLNPPKEIIEEKKVEEEKIVVVEEEEDLEAMMAQAIADSKPAGSQKAAPQVMDLAKNEDPVEEVEQKSAEELLSEFEKMLG